MTEKVKMKLVWIFLGIAGACTVAACFTGPFGIDAVSISCSAGAVVFGLLGMCFLLADKQLF